MSSWTSAFCRFVSLLAVSVHLSNLRCLLYVLNVCHTACLRLRVCVLGLRVCVVCGRRRARMACCCVEGQRCVCEDCRLHCWRSLSLQSYLSDRRGAGHLLTCTARFSDRRNLNGSFLTWPVNTANAQLEDGENNVRVTAQGFTTSSVLE